MGYDDNSNAASDLLGGSGTPTVTADTVSDDLKHNFSRSGIDVDVAGSLDEILGRAGDANVRILDQFSSGDRFVARYSSTVRGEDVPGAAPGSTAEVTGIVMGRVQDGKVTEVYHEQDTVGMLLALGLPVGS